MRFHVRGRTYFVRLRGWPQSPPPESAVTIVQITRAWLVGRVERLQDWLTTCKSYGTGGWAATAHGWGAYWLLRLEYGKAFARDEDRRKREIRECKQKFIDQVMRYGKGDVGADVFSTLTPADLKVIALGVSVNRIEATYAEVRCARRRVRKMLVAVALSAVAPWLGLLVGQLTGGEPPPLFVLAVLGVVPAIAVAGLALAAYQYGAAARRLAARYAAEREQIARSPNGEEPPC